MGLLEDLSIQNSLYKITEDNIIEVYKMNKLPWVIGYSGGKDSTCTTQIIINTLIKMKASGEELNKPVYIISSDTLVENPTIVGTIHKTIDNINALANKEGIPVSAHVIRPEYDNSFWANLIGRGYPCPNQTFRWCTDRMKINPANDFITSIVSKYGEAIVVLGVREGESNSRDRVLSEHTIEGRKLMHHTTMANAYVFAPIRSFTVEDVWNYLLENESPWGSDNKELFNKYMEAEGECPLIIDKEMKKEHTCGNSRFGCWVCTVVTKDKSLTSAIDKGEKWLLDLLEYRNWLYSIRDDEQMRMRRRQDGSIYFSKVNSVKDDIIIPAKGDKKKNVVSFVDGKWIDSFGTEWFLFDGPDCEEKAKDFIKKNNVCLDDGSNPHILVKKINGEIGQLGPGPFTMDARRLILKKLFELQLKLKKPYPLFKEEELLEIRKIWNSYGVYDNYIVDLYYEKFGKELNNVVFDDIKLLDKDDYVELKNICTDIGIDVGLITEILNLEQKYMGYNNRQNLNKALKTTLSKEVTQMYIAEE